MVKISNDPMKFQVQIPDEAAGGISPLVLQPRNATLASSSSAATPGQRVKGVQKELQRSYTEAKCSCIEGLQTWYSRVRLPWVSVDGMAEKHVSNVDDIAQGHVPAVSSNAVPLAASNSANLDACYKDLFTKHTVLCEEHGKLKAEAEGWRSMAVSCQTLSQNEFHKSSIGNAAVAVKATHLATPHPEHYSNINQEVAASSMGQMSLGAGDTTSELCNRVDYHVDQHFGLERECSSWFEPSTVDLTSPTPSRTPYDQIRIPGLQKSWQNNQTKVHYRPNNGSVDDDVVSKCIAVVDGLRVAEANQLVAGFSDPVSVEDSLEVEEALGCVGSENPMTAMMDSRFELPADTGDVVHSIQEKVRFSELNPFVENQKTKGMMTSQNVYTTPEEEVGLDGCESARHSRTKDRCDSRPFATASIVIHPNLMHGLDGMDSSFFQESPLYEIQEPEQYWFSCVEYKCQVIPSCQEISLMHKSS